MLHQHRHSAEANPMPYRPVVINIDLELPRLIIQDGVTCQKPPIQTTNKNSLCKLGFS
jgi:hypothetical protein